MTEFKTRDFMGVVVLKNWMQDPISGRNIQGVAGLVSIIEGKEMIGFDPGTNEANWIARVTGAGRSYNFPGCQVRAVISRDGSPRRVVGLTPEASYIDLDRAP